MRRQGRRSLYEVEPYWEDGDHLYSGVRFWCRRFKTLAAAQTFVDERKTKDRRRQARRDKRSLLEIR